MRQAVFFLATAGAAVAHAASASTAAGQSRPVAEARVSSTVSLYSDSAIAAILRERVESRKTPGIIVGVLDAAGMRFVSHGTGAPGRAVLDSATLFEIGSITKVFTSVVLADMVARGEVTLDDSVAKHLPAGTSAPTKSGRAIRLLHLATHTSGLPRLPNNL